MKKPLLKRILHIGLFMAIAFSLAGPQVPSALAKKPIKIGFGMALTGGLAANGKAAVVAMKIWRDAVNKRGGLLGRKIELVYYDDQTKPATVPGIYTKLLDIDKVDFVVSGYGTNLIAPAMPIVMERGLVYMGLFGLAVNEKFNYNNYFQIMPAGPDPRRDWSRGFFEIAMSQNPKPKTVALIGADAEFARNAVSGARDNAKRLGLKIVYDKTYKPGTSDFTPVARAIKATNPDILYAGSYPPGSVGLIRAAHEIGLKPKMFGGGMVGLQYAVFLSKLGSKLNGVVNYDFWVPEPTLKFPGIEAFLKKYQAKAKKAGVDPLGHYLPPWAYAYLEVLGQAIEGAKTTNQKKVGEYIRTHTFNTIVGKVKFGSNGEWAKTRTLQVQFQGIQGSGTGQFTKPGRRVVLYPNSVKSGNIIYPYSKAN